jgi:tetratricopeptide (TPR) repeat protein
LEPIEEAATSARPRLFISHDADDDLLTALELGRVHEGQPPGSWTGISEQVGILHDGPEGRPVGFQVKSFSTLDADAAEHAELWDGPRFDAPVLGLAEVTVGEIAVAARAFLGGHSSINVQLFDSAVAAEGLEAAHLWMACLQAGDAMANFGLGYTLLDLGHHRDAYRHLRHYTELAPCLAWAWCYRGQAAEAIGEHQEARTSYRRAIALEKDDDPTTARELLAALSRAASG